MQNKNYRHIYLCYIFLTTINLSIALAAEADLTKNLQIEFTPQEQHWIDENPVIYYSDDNHLPPFVFLTTSGKLDGIAIEYLKLIESITHLQFQFIKKENWSEVIASLKNHQIQLVLAAIYSSERNEFAIFSQPYFTSPMAIVTNHNFSYIQDLSELNGKTIAVPKGFYTNLYLKTNFPEINILLANDVPHALKLVNEGKAEAFIGNLGIAIYNLKNSIYTNLKISGSFEEPLDIRFMGSIKDPELISIINKALNLITPSQKRNIENSWFDIEYDQGINPRTLWQVVTLLIFLLILGLAWVKRLKGEVLFRKTSELRLREEQLKSEQANIAKTNFIANMSHEIRTPMNAISGFTQLLEQTPLNQEQKSFIQSIHISTDVLLHIINDILDISEIEHGNIKLHPKALNIKTLVEETLSMFRNEFEIKSLSFTSKFEGNISQEIFVDKIRLSQILINLIANALKFTEKGSVNVQVSMKTSDDFDKMNLKIEVIDSGIGIDSARFEKIFEKFAHHENIKSGYYRGTGLGLTISQKLARLLGGNITVSSIIGRGSTFCLTLTVPLSKLEI